MKQVLTLIFCLALWSCNTTTETKTQPVAKPKEAESVYTDTPQQSASKIIGPKFFDYDAIDYYTITLDDLEISALSQNQSKSESDSFKRGIVWGGIPKNINDLAFINQLEKIGYRKTSIVPSKFKSIDSIFVEKEVLTHEALTACKYRFLDILIFKKKDNVVGTAKICFGCGAHQIKGTEANTRIFGRNGDYERLEKLLKH